MKLFRSQALRAFVLAVFFIGLVPAPILDLLIAPAARAASTVTGEIVFSPTQATYKTGDAIGLSVTFDTPLLDDPHPQITISGATTLDPSDLVKVDEMHYTYNYVVAGTGSGEASIQFSAGSAGADMTLNPTPASGATLTIDNSVVDPAPTPEVPPSDTSTENTPPDAETPPSDESNPSPDDLNAPQDGITQDLTMEGGASLADVPAPTITSLNKSTGPTSGGTALVITGSDFDTPSLMIGGSAATITYSDATTIIALTPSHGSAEAVDVVVTNLDTQFATVTEGFYYATPISTCTEFSNMEPSGHYALLNDLDCRSLGNDVMVGATAETPFIGDFDGNGHQIIVDINTTESGETPTGLFRYVGTFDHVTYIHDLWVTGNIVTTGGWGVGSVGGTVSNTHIDRVISTATIDSTGFGVGGIVGSLGGSSYLQDSLFDGLIAGNAPLGGIVGSTSASVIHRNYSRGNIYSGPDGMFGSGGIVGSQSNSSIHLNFSVASMSGYGPLGGVIGDDLAGSDFSGNYWDSLTSAVSDCIGAGYGPGAFPGCDEVAESDLRSSNSTAPLDEWDFYDVSTNPAGIWHLYGPSLFTEMPSQYPFLQEFFSVGVTTYDVDGIDSTSASFSGSVDDATLGTTSAVGFEISTDGDFNSLETGIIEVTPQEGSYGFGHYASDLMCDTEYFVRAFATNSYGTNYGDIKYFVTGTCDTATTISSCGELADVNNDLAANYQLAGDLNCASEGNNIMIGTPISPYTGHFSGEGYTVTIDIAGGPEDGEIGLFRALSGAVVHDLKVAGSVSGDYSVGGVAGSSRNSTLSRVASTVNVTAVHNYAGGIVGYVFGEDLIQNSYATGTVTGSARVGGIAGYITGGAAIDASYSRSLSISGQYAGGIVGQIEPTGLNSGYISNSFSTSTVSDQYGSGAIVGIDTSETFDTNLSNNYFDVTRSTFSVCESNNSISSGQCLGVNVANAEPNYFINNRIAPPLDDWNFSTVWRTEITSYPSLRSIANDGPVSVTISSLAGASGSTTSTSAIPFHIYFNTAVNDFDLEDIQVVNGTVHSIISSSAGHYQIIVEPSASGPVSVSVPYGVAYDYLGNTNPATSAYVINYNEVVLDAGTGTELDPYQISSCSELQAIRKINYSSDIGKFYRITTDIDCDGINFISIGYYDGNGNGFPATIDGAGHTILNLHVNATLQGSDYSDDAWDTYAAGLLGYAGGAHVRNIIFASPIVKGRTKVGVVIGENQQCTISNVYVIDGTVIGGFYVGGLSGGMYNSTITNSFYSGTVAGFSSVGGIIGDYEGSDSVIENVYSDATITVNSAPNENGYSNFGGIAGNYYNGDIRNSYWSGAMETNDSDSSPITLDYVGGLVGNYIANPETDTITNSFSVGNVFAYAGETLYSNNPGQLVGHYNSTPDLSTNYWVDQGASCIGSGLDSSSCSGNSRDISSFYSSTAEPFVVDEITPVWDFDYVWKTLGNLPFLRSRPLLYPGTPIGTTDDTTPSYTFYTSQDGELSLTGPCALYDTPTTVAAGNVTISIQGEGPYSDGEYSDCQLFVTNDDGDISDALTVPDFTIDTEVKVEPPLVWTEKTDISDSPSGPDGAHGWIDISSSEDGNHLVAVADDDYVYTSENRGASWLQWNEGVTGRRSWGATAISGDGNVAYVAAWNPDREYNMIFKSTYVDGGWSSWTTLSVPQAAWLSLATSYDGSVVAAASHSTPSTAGQLYVSRNGGANWSSFTDLVSAPSSDEVWTGVAMSSDGNTIAATLRNLDIYTFSFGEGWTMYDRSAAGQSFWNGIASSANGRKLAAIEYSGYIHTSIDGGATWTVQNDAGNRNWRGIASSSSGAYLAAVAQGGSIYVSHDSGVTWTAHSSAGEHNWSGVAISGDGQKIAAASAYSGIWTNSPYALGSGVVLDPYSITTCLQLESMSYDTAAYYELAQDIDCSATSISDAGDPQYEELLYNEGDGFAPISTFTGGFNGNAHTIYDLTINRPTAHSAGLFGDVFGNGASINSFFLYGVTVTGAYNVGAVAGYAEGARIYDIEVINGDITSESADATGTGGVIGFATDNTETYLLGFSGSVEGADYTGGLFGYTDGTIERSYASGTVTGHGSQTGGLVGYLEYNYATDHSAEESNRIINSYARTAIHADQGDVGGLAGRAYARIENSYAAGSIHNASGEAGGLVGYAGGNSDGHFDIVNSFATSAITVDDGSAYGLIGSLNYDESLYNTNLTYETAYYDALRTSDYGEIIPCTPEINLCNAINTLENADDTYFFNSELNDPLDQWNWDIWNTRLSSYPYINQLGQDDVVGPDVNITSDADAITDSHEITMHVSFDEEVTGFDESDIIVGNGYVVPESLTGSGDEYTVTISPKMSGEVTVDIDAGVLTDFASNPNSAADQFTLTYESAFDSGSGTLSDPYRISLCHQIEAIGDRGLSDVDLLARLSAHYVLTENIDCSETSYWNPDNEAISHGFIPVGFANNTRGTFGFSGTFNGKNHTISDIHIYDTEDEDMDYVGIFGFMSDGSISSLTVNNADITGTNNVGGLVGGQWGGDISYITFYNNSGVVRGRQNVGGIAGLSITSAGHGISKSKYLGNVEGNTFSGGLAGYLTGTISDSFANVNVRGLNYGESSSSYLGGLVGELTAGAIKESYAAGNISAGMDQLTPLDAGGLVGRVYGAGSNIEHSFSSMSISATRIGTLIGAVVSDIGSNLLAGNYADISYFDPVPNCAGNGSDYGCSTAVSNSGWINGGRDAPLDNEAWDFTTVWQTNEGDYPTLRTGAIEITTCQDLQDMELDLNSNYKLVADLNCYDWSDEYNFTPVGNEMTPFTGSFDGQGHTISYLYPWTEEDSGIFGYVAQREGGDIPEIHDLTIRDSDIEGYVNVGSVVGYASELSLYNVASFNNTVSAYYANAGGLVGYTSGSIATSYAANDVRSNENAGGLVGYLDYNENIENTNAITDSYSHSYVTVTGNRGGGLVGYALAPISRSYAAGYVTTYDGDEYSGDTVGGLVGYAQGNPDGTFDINHSFSTAAIDYNEGQTGFGLIGGLSEYTDALAFDTNVLDTNLAQQSYCAPGESVNCQLVDSSNPEYTGWYTSTASAPFPGAWDFEDTWHVRETSAPYLIATGDDLIDPFTVQISSAQISSGDDTGHAAITMYLDFNTETHDGVNASQIYVAGGYIEDNDVSQIDDTSHVFTIIADSAEAGDITISIQEDAIRSVYGDGVEAPANFIIHYQGAYMASETADGTPEHPYLINNCTQLQNVDVFGGHDSYQLNSDIDCSATGISDTEDPDYDAELYNQGTGFTPIGRSSSFQGNFDGNGKKISDLMIYRPDGYNGYSVGLFGQTYISDDEGALPPEIYNVTLERPSVTGYTYTGALVGYADGNAGNPTLIYDIHVTDAEITGTGSNTGGIVGYMYSTALSNSDASGAITSDESSTGGLVGNADNHSPIEDSYFSGTVDGGTHVGGVAGYSSSQISRTYSMGEVTGENNVGGLVGYTAPNWNNESPNTISDSYSIASVNGNGYYIGGLVGYNYATGVTNSYAAGDVTGYDYVGGLVGWLGDDDDNEPSYDIINSFAAGSVSVTSEEEGAQPYGVIGSLGGNASTFSFGTVYWDGDRSGITNPASCAPSENTCTIINSDGSQSGFFYLNTSAPLDQWSWNSEENPEGIWATRNGNYPYLYALGLDAPAPTDVAITRDGGSFSTNVSPIAYTITFTEDVTGLSAENLPYSDDTATLTDFYPEEGSSRIYHAVLTPNGPDVYVSIGLNGGEAYDSDENPTPATSPVVVHYDTVSPTAAITYSPSRSSYSSGTSLTITAAFNEDMSEDVTPKITLSGASTLAATNMTRVDATHYTYVFTVGSGNGTTTVALGTGTDLAGNAVTTAPTSGATFQVSNTSNGGGGGGGSGSILLPTPTVTPTPSSDTPTNRTARELGLPFKDVDKHFAIDYIKTLYDMKVIQGRTPTEFKPDAPLTRAEIVKIALLTFGYDTKGDLSLLKSFKDTDAKAWYAPLVAAAKAAGIISGYNDGTFRPDAPVTRAEALKILILAAKKSVNGSASSPFADIIAGAWYKQFVDYAFANGVVSGKNKFFFRPNDNITRGEMAKVDVKLFQIK